MLAAAVKLQAAWTPVPGGDGAVTLYLDELYGNLVIDDQGYRCGEPNIYHSFSGRYILTQRNAGTPTSHTVTVRPTYSRLDFDITLDGVNIEANGSEAAFAVGNDAQVALTLRGNNALQGGADHAGLETVSTESNTTTSVTINGGESDSLTATGGSYGAGIGGGSHYDYGTITISGGTVTTRRTDGVDTVEIGKCPDASGGICQVRLSSSEGCFKDGDAQIFVSGADKVTDKPAVAVGGSNYYWNGIVYEGNNGQLYVNCYTVATVNREALTVPAGKTLTIPQGVLLQLPQQGLRLEMGADLAGDGRVYLGDTLHYIKTDGTVAPCEVEHTDKNGIKQIYNTLQSLVTGTYSEGIPLLRDSGHMVRLLTDVDYPEDIIFDFNYTPTNQTSGILLDLNGKTLNMGDHRFQADVYSSSDSPEDVFTITDSSAESVWISPVSQKSQLTQVTVLAPGSPLAVVSLEKRGPDSSANTEVYTVGAPKDAKATYQ